MPQKHRSRPSQDRAAPAIDRFPERITDRTNIANDFRDWQARRLAGKFLLSLPIAAVIAELHLANERAPA